MSKYNKIPIVSKLRYCINITGYSKFFNWLFNSVIKLKTEISPYAPQIIESLLVKIIINAKNYITENAPSLFENIQSTYSIKFTHNAIPAFIEKYNDVCLFTKFGFRAAISLIEEAKMHKNTIKIIMTADPVVRRLYLVRDWDYKIPGDPDSVRWYVRELDSMTVRELDEK